MDEKDEQIVKNLIQEFFSREWAEQCDVLERKTMAAVSSAISDFKTEMSKRMGREHSENITRIKFLDEKVDKSVSVANEAVSQNKAILIGQERQGSQMDTIQTIVQSIREEVAEWRGIRKTEHRAEKESEETRNRTLGYIKWIVGLGASGGLVKWVMSLFHHQPK